MTPCVAALPPHPNRHIWPTTATLVFLACLLMLIQGFGAVMEVSSFLGSTPSRDNYISAASACLTTLPAFAALIWWGWLNGSRVGIWLIGGPAVVMVMKGLNLLATTADSHGPISRRDPNLEDLTSDWSLFSWGEAAVFGLCALATHLQRRRARHSELALPA